MANAFKQEVKVLSSKTDEKCRLGVLGTFGLLQDNMCEYFRNLKCDGLNLVPTHNCFFVVSKTKVHFNSNINWLDRVSIVTEDVKVSKVAVDLHTTFDNSAGNQCIDCTQEMCVMDCTSRRLRLVNSTPFPMENVCGDRLKIFEKLQHLDDGECVGDIVVRYSNIDFYRHTNNVEYVRFILDCMPIEMTHREIVDFEIHYLQESRLGDNLKVFFKQIDNIAHFEIRCNNYDIVRARVLLA